MGSSVNTGFIDHFKNDWFLLSDFADMFVGGHIASGQSRSVYEYRLNAHYVIKIDRSGQFNNVAEWEIWHAYKNEDHISKFLAPCYYLSSCGRVMLQHRTKRIIDTSLLPKTIPDIFHDVKIQNWGMIGKRPVCHDYANHRIYNPERVGTFNPEWWSDTYQLIHDQDPQRP